MAGGGEAIRSGGAHYRKAVELDTYSAEAMTNLGLLYMQTGHEAQARAILERAHEIDDFRADVVNYLRLLENLEKFQVHETDHFTIRRTAITTRCSSSRSASTQRRFMARYAGFRSPPAGKTIVEVFPTHGQFSVRITGKG